MTVPFYVAPEQLMKDRADYARSGIARGRSVIALRYPLRKRAWDALVHYYADGAPADQAKVLVQAGLRGIVEDHPDMVAIVDGEPSLQGSNDQLQRLVAYVESLGKPGEDVPF